jgi:CBS domain-containing protein
MNAAQVMTRQPVTASPGMSVRDAAKLLLAQDQRGPGRRRLGGVLGIVSEGDLVR